MVLAGIFDFLRNLAPIAQIGSTLIFAISLWIGFLQIRRNRENQLRATAITLWDKYLDRTIQYPTFACPEGFEKSFEKLEERKIDGCSKEFERYEWFVASLIRTSNEILASYDNSPERHNMVRRNIGYHKRYIRYKTSAFFMDLGPDVWKIVVEAEDQHRQEIQVKKVDIPHLGNY